VTGRGPAVADRIYLLDANNLTHRLYHSSPDLYAAPDRGYQPINAVAAWVRFLRRFKREHAVDWLVPIFDGEGDGWRAQIFPGYKAGRTPHDDALTSQWPLVKQLLGAMQLPVVCVPAVEADDLIASYAEAAVKRGLEVVVVSNDKDLAQLVRGDRPGPGSIRQLVPGKKGEMRGPAEALAKFGVGPELLGDLLALAGDKSDSIPGVPGVGFKTAAKLLGEHGNLEQLLDRWSLVPGKMGPKLRDHAEQARLSRRLVELVDVELPVPLSELRPWVTSRRALDGFFAGLGFSRFEAAVDRYEGPGH
jgi:DNA polymerase-1